MKEIPSSKKAKPSHRYYDDNFGLQPGERRLSQPEENRLRRQYQRARSDYPHIIVLYRPPDPREIGGLPREYLEWDEIAECAAKGQALWQDKTRQRQSCDSSSIVELG